VTGHWPPGPLALCPPSQSNPGRGTLPMGAWKMNIDMENPRVKYLFPWETRISLSSFKLTEGSHQERKNLKANKSKKQLQEDYVLGFQVESRE